MDEKLRAILAFLEKVTTAPADVVPADAEAVLAAGVTRQGVEDALYVSAMFATITRLADAFAFGITSDADFEASAKSLIEFGYKL